VLTVVYCRVSTEEQAGEGFSIAGQADRLRAYAELHELGPVTVIEDPGWSGKDLNRPGLQQLLAMVEAGHVAHVLIWRLDRLSRSLGDLILLADKFGQAEVPLHSFTEKLDLSSATGRMFYNILGSFAQFYREQLSENVRMGTRQGAQQGKWMNRPKTGYDLIDGNLVPNADADRVHQAFVLRAQGRSHREIEEDTGIKYSTAVSILQSRIYLGEVLHNGTWYPGSHEPIITQAEFAAAHRGRVPGRRKGRDLLSGKVLCGLCGKRMSVEILKDGRCLYRCWHRGAGCKQPRRTNTGLHRAAGLAMRLLGRDERLQEAIRRQLAGTARREPAASRRTARQRPGEALAALSERRRKLLELYYKDRISGELFAEEEGRLASQIEAFRAEATDDREKQATANDVSVRFEAVAAALRDLDVESVWQEANESERRVLVDELVEEVAVFPDHLEVKVVGAPRINVTLGEVGLKVSGERWCRRTDPHVPVPRDTGGLSPGEVADSASRRHLRPVKARLQAGRRGTPTGRRAHGIRLCATGIFLCVRRVRPDWGGPANGRPARDRRRRAIQRGPDHKSTGGK